MIWESSESAPERILLMGPAGSGKSNAIMDMAEMTGGNVHVLDTELDVYERLNKERGLKNLHIAGVMPDDWEAMNGTVKDWLGLVAPGDIVVVDSMTATWTAVAQWFAEDVLGGSISELLLQKRKGQGDGDKNLVLMDGWRDYQVINQVYATFMNNLLRCSAHPRKAHLVMTAGVKDMPENADRNMRAAYGKVGMVPAGNKNLGHFPHSVMLMRRTRAAWEMETVKDQGRKEIDGEVNNFGKQYLGGVAGWRVASS